MGIRKGDGRIKNVEYKALSTPKLRPWKKVDNKREAKSEEVNS